MALEKPSWLKTWLNKLNWDIFTWKVYIGDAIESAIDWALEKINSAYDWARDAYSKAWEAWDKALEIGAILSSKIYTEVQKVANQISTWWSDLGDWWQSKKQDVLEWIDTAKDWAKDRINAAWGVIDRVDAAWENFKRDTLPKLLDTSWVTSFFGKGITSISDWWAPKKQEIDDHIETEVQPVRDEVNKHTSWLDLIKELFTDPEKWLFNMIERMLSRFL